MTVELHYTGSAFNGHLDVTKYLISQGAEVNRGDNDGRTALHFAAQEGHLDVTKYLISQGAEVNKGDNDGWTAFHACCFQDGHLDVTEYLISQGAEVNKGDNDGMDCISQCCPGRVILMSPNISSVKELR